MSIYGVSNFLREVGSKPEHFCIIHYSCQNLYGDNEGLSPRITSIVVMYLGSEQTLSFSTHAVAEELGIPKEDVGTKFDDIERKLLEKFYAFVRDHRDLYWLHWNMRNLTYGFEHIEHRYRILTKTDAPSIPVERRLNINDYLSMRYGPQYVADPKLQKTNGVEWWHAQTLSNWSTRSRGV